jgi:hypothetical protein
MTPDYPKPIVPPPELSDEQVGEWLIDDDYPWDPSEQAVITITPSRLKNVARQAYQAGADQELEACCLEIIDGVCRLYVDETKLRERLANDLRAARRPKPPSLKEQALQELEQLRGDANSMGMGFDAPAIRRALEALPDG